MKTKVKEFFIFHGPVFTGLWQQDSIYTTVMASTASVQGQCLGGLPA